MCAEPGRRAAKYVAACTAALLLAASVWILRPSALPAQDGRALEFVDRNGLGLGTILSRDNAHAAYVPLRSVAPAFVRALLATEDERFSAHGPLDARSTLRAVVRGVGQATTPSGASTISMQVARLVHAIAPGIAGRLEELVLAARLENAASKRSILEAYCNRAPMGGNVYGVEAAARTYFGVHASELDVAQATLLAAIPNDPEGLSPYRHWTALKGRQRIVLGRMVATGALSPSDAERAGAETLALRAPSAGIVAAPHALFWLAQQYRGAGSVVRTTLDRSLQHFVQEQLRSVVGALASHDVHDAAALVVDNRNGEILAYAGSPDYFDDVALGRNDGVQALRQPGSALKPFLYELALERRAIRPNTILLDAPIAYAIPGGRLYQPTDYDRRFQGPVRVRLALGNSLNVPAVRVLERVGVPAFLERLHALGFAHLRATPDFYGLGLTLGGGEVSLLELTRAFTTLARGGHPTELTALQPDRALVREDLRAADPAWSLVTDILADPHARALAFGVDSVLALPFPSAVKTGTSSDFRDTWTVGFTRDYTVGVWVGNFNGAPMRSISGVTGAGPLWNRIMLRLHQRTEPASFARPAGYRRLPICAATGLRPERSCATLAVEWLDPSDQVAYAHVASPVRRAPLAIAFPHDGDRFVLIPGGGRQRIDVDVVTAVAGALRVTVDGKPATHKGDAFIWDLRLGSHVIAARRGGDVATAHIRVERPPVPVRPGFTVVSR